MTIEQERHGKCLDEAFGELFGLLVRANLILHNNEFVAAKARHDITRPANATQSFRDRLEQKITAIMSEGVIDFLELVEIDEVGRQSAALGNPRYNQAVKSFDELGSVREPS
jgi:hypothetical protein